MQKIFGKTLQEIWDMPKSQSNKILSKFYGRNMNDPRQDLKTYRVCAYIETREVDEDIVVIQAEGQAHAERIARESIEKDLGCDLEIIEIVVEERNG